MNCGSSNDSNHIEIDPTKRRENHFIVNIESNTVATFSATKDGLKLTKI